MRRTLVQQEYYWAVEQKTVVLKTAVFLCIKLHSFYVKLFFKASVKEITPVRTGTGGHLKRCFMKKIIVITALLFTQARLFAGDEENIVPATLKSVIVYRAGAGLTHSARAALKQGNNNLTIEGLANGIDINSVQIGAEEKLTIMSVEYATDYLKQSVKTVIVKKLEDSLEAVSKESVRIQVIIKTDNELIDLLKANREIRGAQTGMPVAELMKMMDYYKNKSLDIQNEIALYQEKQIKLAERIKKINLQINEEEQKNNKATGKLMLQVLSPMAGVCNLTISYITSKAYWNPCYHIRAENISKPISLLYKAKLVQTTGIDWKQVRLTLASSAPNQNNNAPILKSWFLSYTNPVTKMENNLYMNSVQSILQGNTPGLNVNSQLNEVVVTGFGNKDAEDGGQKIRIRGLSSLKEIMPPVYIVSGEPISQREFEKIDPKNIKKIDVLKGDKAVAAYGTQAASGAI